MNIQQNIDKRKINHNYISLINSIEMPLCKNFKNINDLRSGDLFLELLMYYFNNIRKEQNYLSLINTAYKVDNSFEKMNIIFHIMPKIVNNYEIKSRIESFHNNINEFLKNDNLIIEFLSYIIFLYNKSGYGYGHNRINKFENNTNLNKKRNLSLSQISKNERVLNFDEDEKYKRKIINYNKVREENKSLPNNSIKNNFLFYINNKTDNIINIDNNMNFRFINGISNLKTQNINTNNTKEIKSYTTKPKIIKYQYPSFNSSKNEQNLKKNEMSIQSEISPNYFRNYIKEEENKKNLKNQRIQPKFDRKNNFEYFTCNPDKYNPINNIIEEENKLKLYIENKSEIQNKQDEETNFENKNNSPNKLKMYKLLRLPNNRIKYKNNEKYLEEETKGKTENIKIENHENNRIKNQKRFFNSRSKNYKNKINKNTNQPILNNNFDYNKKTEIKRQASFPLKYNEQKYENINYNQTDFNKQTQKSLSYLHYKYEKNLNEDSNYKIENNNDNKINNSYNKQIDKEEIYLWILDLNLVKNENLNLILLPQLISDGKLLCDIINSYENKNNQINNISDATSIKENALMNIQKALEHLNKIEDFPKTYISDYEPIFEIESDFIWKLLNDLYCYYLNKGLIQQNYKQKNNEIISSNIISSNDINNYKEKSSKKICKKSRLQISDLNYNNVKSKNLSHKNINIKNILFKGDKNESRKYNQTLSSVNNNKKYNYSYNNRFIVNNEENLIKNNSTTNIYNEDDIPISRTNKNVGKKKNYFYYVNAFKNYFDKDKNNQGINENKENINSENKCLSGYSENKYESFFSNPGNKLYFNYSNNLNFKKKKKIYSHNPKNKDIKIQNI